MAIKTLQTLIKVHKQKADFLRREMVALENELHQLQQLEETLRRQYAEEMKLIAEQPELSGFFGSYSEHVKKKVASLGKETQRVQTAIEEKRNAISEEYSEQKKYEIARENLDKTAAEQEKHRQQGRFDEVGSQQYLRQKENNG